MARGETELQAAERAAEAEAAILDAEARAEERAQEQAAQLSEQEKAGTPVMAGGRQVASAVRVGGGEVLIVDPSNARAVARAQAKVEARLLRLDEFPREQIRPLGEVDGEMRYGAGRFLLSDGTLVDPNGKPIKD
jgi:hypothetical protein